ncbi:MAG: GldG family protein [Chloroflexi bacterium]|nr:GldG family protein [Chloroflexota bacterium]
MWRRITSSARYVGLFGALILAVALGGWLVTSQLKPWIEILATAGAVLIALSVIMQPQRVKEALFGKRTRYASNAVVVSLAVMLIVALLNYLGARYHTRFDLTEDKQFTLSEQTVQILDGLQEPVKATLFYTPSHYNRASAEDLVKEYAQQSDQFSYQIIDPDAERVTALNYQVARDGTVIFERGDRREVTFGATESDFTGTLLKVLSDATRGVYFVSGHGELHPDVTDGTGCSSIKQVLESENYVVGTLSLAVTDAIPEDAVALVVAGPQQPFSQQEVDRLSRYLDEGGRLVVLYEPGMADPLLGLLARYGLEIQDDIVVEPTNAFYGDFASPFVTEYTYHHITKDLTGMPSLFPTARALHLLDPLPAEWSVTALAMTSGDAWAETAYRDAEVRADAETVGPIALAVAIEPSTTDTELGRLVVVGDADLIGDQLLASITGGLGNIDLFMNSIGWLSEEESLISIRPQEPTDRSVYLSGAQANSIIYTGLLFAPLAVLAIGAYVWWKHR